MLTLARIGGSDPRLEAILDDLRDSQRVEVTAQRWSDDPASLGPDYVRLVAAGGAIILVGEDGAPGAALSLLEVSPGVAQLGMIATRAWERGVPRSLWKWLARSFIPHWLDNAGVRRAEIEVIAGSDVRWLERLGFEVWGRRVAAGKRGEDFLCLARLAPAARQDSRPVGRG